MARGVPVGRAGGGEEKRKYAEDINLPRLIETRKTCEALQRWGQNSLKEDRKSNKKIWGVQETERWKVSGESDGKAMDGMKELDRMTWDNIKHVSWSNTENFSWTHYFLLFNTRAKWHQMKIKDNGYKHPKKKCCFFRTTGTSTAITEQVFFFILPACRAMSTGV